MSKIQGKLVSGRIGKQWDQATPGGKKCENTLQERKGGRLKIVSYLLHFQGF